MNNEEYRAHIDRLVREMKGELVLNGSHSHATIIVERMFANAERNVSILTRRFDPRIYGTSELIEQAELFLGRSDRTVDIIVEELDEEALSDHPFVNELHRFMDRGNLKLKRVPAQVSALIKINFALMDDKGYRFEKDKTEAVASAAFGDAETTRMLRDLFALIWQTSEPVSVRVTA